GEGKSLRTCDWTARVTRGRPWPTGETAPQGRVLFLCAEDAIADTIRPRLDAAGADVSAVDVLTGIHVGGMERLVNLSTDVTHITTVFDQYRPAMMVIDPLSAYLGAADSYKNTDTRKVLAPLLAISERYHCVLVWILHLNKNTEHRAIFRAGGSVAFTAAARVAIAVGPHPHDPDRHAITQSKNNLTRRPCGWTFTIHDQHIEWG